MSSGVGVVLANIRGMSRGDAGREGVWIFEGGFYPGSLEDTPLV